MTGKSIRFENVAGLLLGICLGCVVLLLLAGCTAAPIWGSWSNVPTKQQIAAALGRPETYIYFTNYEIYRQPARQEYVFWDGRAWVTSKQPPIEVTAELLDASPQVEVALYEHPGRYHAGVAKQHPRVWQSPDSYVASAP